MSVLQTPLACTPTFEAPEQVTDLRVLAIQAEPPEALVDADAGTSEDVQVTALVLDPPHPQQAVQVTPALCLPSDGARCTTTSVELANLKRPQGEISFSLQTQIIAKQIPAARLVALLQAAVQDDKLKGLGGIRLQLMLTIDDLQGPYGPQTALKTLLFSPRTPDGNPNRNHNPAVDGLSLIDLDTRQVTQSPANGESFTLFVGKQLGLRPRLAPGSIEEYPAIDLSGRVVRLREELSWSFYTTIDGDLDRGTADEPGQGVGDPPYGLVRFQGAKAGASGRFWAVVRDGRGGSAWTSHRWSAVRP